MPLVALRLVCGDSSEWIEILGCLRVWFADETGGVVIDVGTSTTKAGFCGEDSPRSVFPSLVGKWNEGGEERFVAGEGALRYRHGKSLHGPLDDGLVQDWDTLERVLEHSYSEIHADCRAHPLVLVMPPLLPEPQRERLLELAFEGLGVPAVYVARSSVTAAFSAGLSSAVVVDLGAAQTRASPVYDGYQLNRGVQQSPVGGNALAEMAAAIVEERIRRGILPAFAIDRVRLDASAAAEGKEEEEEEEYEMVDDGKKGEKRRVLKFASTLEKNLQRINRYHGGSWRVNVREEVLGGCHPSFLEEHRRRVGAEALATLALVTPTTHIKEIDSEPVDEAEWFLPDGERLSMSSGRLRLGELALGHLFAARAGAVRPPVMEFVLPELRDTIVSGDEAALAAAERAAAVAGAVKGPHGRPYLPAIKARIARVSAATGTATGTQPIALGPHRLIHTALIHVDPEIRAGLANNILVTGGLSLIPGLPDRLHGELAEVIPPAFRHRVVAGSNLEQHFAPWIGGAVLSALGNFQKLWISKAEFDDEGPGIVEKRCP